MSTRYRKVSQNETELGDEELKKQKSERVERITAKIHALVWVAVSVIIVYYTDLVNVILYSDEINRTMLYISVSLITANTIIVFYLTLWLPLVEKVTVAWEVHCPSMIPISTALGVLSVLGLIITFWPLWGLLSPLIILVLVFGLLFSTHFIPWPC